MVRREPSEGLPLLVTFRPGLPDQGLQAACEGPRSEQNPPVGVPGAAVAAAMDTRSWQS